MAEAANALDGDDVACTGAGMAKSVEDSDAGAEERCGLGRIEALRDWRDGLGAERYIFSIPTVAIDACSTIYISADEYDQSNA
jgi:hypothetical protein